MLSRLKPGLQRMFPPKSSVASRPLVMSSIKTGPGLARKYEINSDMGEGFGRWKMGPDEELMPLIDAANIACGFHAGDPSIMLKTIRLCKQHGVRAGAHPGLQDLFGFGRRKMQVSPGDMYAMVLYQVGALKAMLDAEGVELSHIKPHGELYFYMQRDATIMRVVLEACSVFNVPVYACQNPEQQAMCDEMGIPFQGEVYVDVNYSPEGKIIPVSHDQVITPEMCYDRAYSAAVADSGKDVNGDEFKYGFEGRPFSVCLHSDVPTVLENAKRVRKAVDEANRISGFLQ
ncbi:Lactam utilization protein lamB [Paramyrothecium foliicola]|nr:Lactam utilization protein lamB [Paramyrothecium foliicola]